MRMVVMSKTSSPNERAMDEIVEIPEDAPGTSGMLVPPRQPKVAWVKAGTITSLQQENEAIDDPLQSAWTDFTERVSVAGWKEAFDEPIIWIRHQYKVALLVFSAISVYYSCRVVVQFVKSGYADEISDFALLVSLPMSNVTICAQVYFNQTFIRENLTIPLGLWSKIAKLDDITSHDEFYRQLALYLSPITRPKEIDQRLVPFFEKIIRQNLQIRDYISFAKAAWPKCDDMLRKCRFGGIEFECCQNAAMSVDDDGICFSIPLNMDSDNAYPFDSTQHQRTPGPDGGLTVEARLVITDFPMISNDAQNGFRILVQHTPASISSSPVGVPHGSETYIKVIPEKHKLASKCAPHGNLRVPFDRDHEYVYYDPEGGSCAFTKGIDNIEKMVSCHHPGYFYHPNASIVCPPRIKNMLISLLVEQNYTLAIASKGAMATGLSEERINKLYTDVESQLKDTLTDKSRCPRHCEYWTYRSTASFHYLQSRREKDDEMVVDYMFSRIHVYYGSLDYRQHREVPETSVYLAFCDFGNVVGLYWGMSIVSFFHVFYYVSRYFYVKRKIRRVTQQGDRTPVVRFIATSQV